MQLGKCKDTVDYLLENLGPERFQEVCQSLLAKVFPRTQCFPVAQRDGGRDALAYISEKRTEEFIVFQVKYVRKPLAEKDPHAWLEAILADEIPKVGKLISRGAKEYYILTNVPGTAFPDSGSIDKVQTLLSAQLDVPSQCWWREDINRRLDDAWNIKWAYPEILSGPDILRAIVQSGLAEHRERRTSAIETFVRDQFDRDRQVRFKQVELQNNLLDLFIDVPVRLCGERTVRKRQAEADSVLYAIDSATSQDDEDEESLSIHHYREEARQLGAATAFLHSYGQRFFSHIVLEGAPGQGKSTIAQYICQIHRRRVLGETTVLTGILEAHRVVPARIPFKTDLRDFAAWLGGEDPFSAENATRRPESWHKSLEAFLAAQVRHSSGGVEFSVADLHAVAKLSCVLLVFDGLDEVADLTQRRQVVDELVKGINRLGGSAASMQVIVTTRPAAFPESPGLPTESFTRFELCSITREIINTYAQKWVRAKGLDGNESDLVRRILRDKLDQPHLRELARNPMQLAILLSLIHTRGTSLPDKRTALYDSYIELFFSREAEKSTIVREHRDLLVEIHGYIAWTLHSEAETGTHRGSLTVERLRRLVGDYLEREQHEVSLVDQLFSGMVERVVALVSRVEGTLEFEVQPLREYFAAKFLYDTAPYSPPGTPHQGTLPDRFDAISKSPYWQNVTRFYAGCYSKGQLPSLVDCLEELARHDTYRHTSYPQSLAATLLADWVFAQHPRSMKKVVGLVIDGLGLRHFLAAAGGPFRGETLFVLPVQCGNEELLDHGFAILARHPPRDFAFLVIRLLRQNAPKGELEKRWLQHMDAVTGDDRNSWFRYGLYSGVLSSLDVGTVKRVLGTSPFDSEKLSLLVQAGQSKFLESTQTLFESTVSCMLSGEAVFPSSTKTTSLLEHFGIALNPFVYSRCFERKGPMSLAKGLRRYQGLSPVIEVDAIDNVPKYEIANKCLRLLRVVEGELEQSTAAWATETEPWTTVVETIRDLFGNEWAAVEIANVAAGIRSRTARCPNASDLLDADVPLVHRARHARLKSGQAAWWTKQLDGANDSDSQMIVSLLFLSWVGPSVVSALIGRIDEILQGLTPAEWSNLVGSVERCLSFTEGHRSADMDIEVSGLPHRLSDRSVAVLGMRSSARTATTLFRKYLEHYDGDDSFVLSFAQDAALQSKPQDLPQWRKCLSIISRSYGKGVASRNYLMYRLFGGKRSRQLPLEIAREVVESPDKYPSDLVGVADARCRKELSSAVVPVAKIAEQGGWFAQ